MPRRLRGRRRSPGAMETTRASPRLTESGRTHIRGSAGDDHKKLNADLNGTNPKEREGKFGGSEALTFQNGCDHTKELIEATPRKWA